MGMFDDIDKAQASSHGGTYVRPGHYFARIDRVKAGTSQQDSSEYVAVEMTIVTALPDGDLPMDDNFNVLGKDTWHREGEIVSHLMQAKHKSFQGNFKAFVANIGGLPEKDIQKSHCVSVTENGLFEGLFVEIRARTIKTKKQQPFTIVGYTREVPPTEIQDRVEGETLDRILGPGKIDELIEAFEAEEE